MSVGVVVLRLDEEGNEVPIPLEEWQALVERRPDLQMRREPYIGTNPKTGAQLKIRMGVADSEVLIGGQWLPFLRFQRGTLVCEYQSAFESASNPEREKIASIANELGAVIGTDAGDELFEW